VCKAKEKLRDEKVFLISDFSNVPDFKKRKLTV